MGKDRGGRRAVERLVAQAARWAVAAKQDEAPLVALMHANYGAGYLWGARDLAVVWPPEYQRLEAEIVGIQRAATMRALRECPALLPQSADYAASPALRAAAGE